MPNDCMIDDVLTMITIAMIVLRLYCNHYQSSHEHYTKNNRQRCQNFSFDQLQLGG